MYVLSKTCLTRHAVPEHEEKRRGNIWAPAHSPTMAGDVSKFLLCTYITNIWSNFLLQYFSNFTNCICKSHRLTTSWIWFFSQFYSQVVFLPSTGPSLKSLGLTTLGLTSVYKSKCFIDIFTQVLLKALSNFQGLTSGALRTLNSASKPGCVEEPLRLCPAHMSAIYLGGQPFEIYLGGQPFEIYLGGQSFQLPSCSPSESDQMSFTTMHPTNYLPLFIWL